MDLRLGASTCEDAPVTGPARITLFSSARGMNASSGDSCVRNKRKNGAMKGRTDEEASVGESEQSLVAKS